MVGARSSWHARRKSPTPGRGRAAVGGVGFGLAVGRARGAARGSIELMSVMTRASVVVLLLCACEETAPADRGLTRASVSILASAPPPAATGAATAAGPANAAASAPPPAATGAATVVGPTNAAASAPPPAATVAAACPSDMVLIDGDYCPAVVQKCLQHHQEWEREQARVKRLRAEGKKASTSASERCLRYQQPSRCISKQRLPMRYCIDRYEWPNRKGELPHFLVNWHEATAMCKEVGKRLCTIREFNFACEGEQMLPYTYGYQRDASKCAIDKPYIRRRKSLKRYARCIEDPTCKAEMERLDQREPAGARPQCVSPFGVYDLNGNINEWVLRPGKKAPNRSGLKSGWWGPVRGRCRPTVGFHKEDDYGYEVGFRCCADVTAAGAKDAAGGGGADAAPPAPTVSGKPR